jgi:hypothetical protein
MISSPTDREKILRMIKEISDSMTRIESERDLINETIKDMSDQFQLNKKYIRRMAKVYHRQNFQQEKQEHEEFETLYEQVTTKG